MDRDPQSLADDIATYDTFLASLDPEESWAFGVTSAPIPALGYGGHTLTVAGTPAGNKTSPVGGLLGCELDGVDDLFSSSALPESTTTFSLLFLLRFMQGAGDADALIFGDHVTGKGLRTGSAVPAMVYFDTGSTDVAGLPGIALREMVQIGLSVTAGVAVWTLNGVPYEPDGDTAIPTFTPTRLGAVSAGTFRLRAQLWRAAYWPRVVITTAEFAALWSQRYPCHTASLAVVNQALAHIGEKALTNLSTDLTPAAVQARLHYPTAVDSVLRDFNWPFAKRYATLTLLGGTEATALNSDWQYSYRAPDRMVRAVRIVAEYYKRSFDPAPPPFEVGQDDLGPIIYTDQVNAELEYTVRTTCPASHGDVLFREALAWYLASLCAPSVAKNEATANSCLGKYAVKLAIAEAAAANEQVPQDQDGHDPSWLRDR